MTLHFTKWFVNCSGFILYTRTKFGEPTYGRKTEKRERQSKNVDENLVLKNLQGSLLLIFVLYLFILDHNHRNFRFSRYIRIVLFLLLSVLSSNVLWDFLQYCFFSTLTKCLFFRSFTHLKNVAYMLFNEQSVFYLKPSVTLSLYISVLGYYHLRRLFF